MRRFRGIGASQSSNQAPLRGRNLGNPCNVVGENFLEAMVAANPRFRLEDVRYRVSSDVPNGTLRQRPAVGTPIDSTTSEILIRVVVSVSSG